VISEHFKASRPIIDDAAAAAGRDPREIRTVFNLSGRITDQPLDASRDRVRDAGSEGRSASGSRTSPAP
jgi:alkanesulfonate monooxygenase SsuD/methylene tetrahydromethanopterin reductase-like flavin-dependent oxidoreductase (luciferase family)